MKFLKLFKNESEYNEFKSNNWVTPNVCYIKGSKTHKFNSKKYVKFVTSDSDFTASDGAFYSIAGSEFYNN